MLERSISTVKAVIAPMAHRMAKLNSANKTEAAVKSRNAPILGFE
jgi:hypothetical protein